MLTLETPSLPEVVVQLRLTVPPGRLAEAAAALAAAGVCLSAVSAVQARGSVRLSFVPDDAETARRRLDRAGYSVRASKAFRLRLDAGSDALQRLADGLAARGLSILSCYGRESGGAMDLVVEVDRPDEAADLLARAG